MSASGAMNVAGKAEPLEALFQGWADVLLRLEAQLADGMPEEEALSRLLDEMADAFNAVRRAVDRPLDPQLLGYANELLSLHERLMAQARELARKAAASASEVAGKRKALAGYRRALGVNLPGPMFIDARI